MVHSARAAEVLEEIIVSAQKIQSSESKTPISMEVYGARELASKGITDIVTLAFEDPSVNFDSGNGAGFITIRGVASHDTTEIGDPAVPIATDGFFVNRPYVFNHALYDIDRIEVLRGPQGTLWGRNATGGLISIVNNEPTKEFGGYGQITFGNFRTLNSEGAVNLPLSDKLQIRVAFSSLQHAGYRTTVYGSPVDDDDSKSGRLRLAYEPTDTVRFLLTYQYTHLGGAGAVDNITLLPADTNGTPTHMPVPLNERYNISFPSYVQLDDRAYRWRAVVDDLPGGVSFTYLGGYDTLTWHHGTPLTPPDTSIGIASNEDPRTWNHEVRFTSAQDKSLTWQAGAFFYDEHNADINGHFRDFFAPASADLVSFLYDVKDRSIAGFGQINYKLTDELQVSAGARYTHDSKSRLDRSANQLGAASWSRATWHLGADWNPTAENLVYGKVETGYKAGGFNLFVPLVNQNLTITEPYNPETITNVEIGSKNRLFAERVSVNVAAFYMAYKGQQLQISNAGGVATENARTSKLYGLELQTKALWDPIGRFDLSASLLHAKFGPGTNIADYTGTNIAIDGNNLTQAPPLSLVAGFEHSWELQTGTVTARLETKYQSKQYFDFFNFPDSVQQAYWMSGARVGFESSDQKWLAEVFVRNIENKLVLADESESFAPPENTYNYGFAAPRTYGLRIRANF